MTQRRNRRGGVEDRWTKTVRDEAGKTHQVRSAAYGKGKRWRARYVDAQSREHEKLFRVKADAKSWLDGQTASVVSGTHVAPRDAQLTVEQWCDLWIEGYKVNRVSTVRQARTHIKHIVAAFGDLPLTALRPTQIKVWVSKLQEHYKPSYVHALHSRLAQICWDAVNDGYLGRNPCSRRTSPPMGQQKPYVISTDQMWALHNAMPEHFRVAVLLGAFAGLRVAEVCALRVADVDFMRGVITPVQQWPDVPLKTQGSSAPIPIPSNMTLMLSASVQKFPSEYMVTNGAATERAGPWLIDRAVRVARPTIEGLPETFSFHDLRHYLASLLIAGGSDIKAVQARMRHQSARTTLDTYSHLWPDADESTRSAIDDVIAEQMDCGRTAGDQAR